MSGGEGEKGSRLLADRFRHLTGRPPEGQWCAPGRVNLIGEHTDYNGGLALPFAIDRHIAVAVGRRSDRLVRCWSAGGFGDAMADLDDLAPGSLVPWARYPIGVLWAFLRLGGLDLPGVDLVVESTLPAGAGLSSSAALEAAVAMAMNDLCQAGLDRLRLAQLCHAAETDFVGAPVGMLDQLAVLLAEAGHGLLIDFGSMAVEPLPLSIGPLVVVDTGIRHHTADGLYQSRRRACQQAASQLGLTDLGAATRADVEDRLTGELQQRARHVVTENGRVREAARRLPAGLGIGDLLSASHASLRDDFQVSCPELDAVVEVALAAGALGARMTGAGFGGCAIVLGLEAETLADALHGRLSVFSVVPAEGAHRLG